MMHRAGSWILWRGVRYEIAAITGFFATLRDEDGTEVEVSLDELGRSAEEALASNLATWSGPRDEAATAEVELWREALRRMDADVAAGSRREDAIAKELPRLAQQLGRAISARKVYRQMEAYATRGAAGLVDGRTRQALRPKPNRVDPRVLELVNRVLASRARASTTHKIVVFEQVATLLSSEFGDSVKMPSRATFYRMLEKEDRGRFSFKSAKTRESLALQPPGAFGRRTPLRPGEQTQIDSTRLDVMVRIDEQTIGRPELTILLDVATRSILAAVLRPEGTKSVDLVVVLARALVPYSRRPDGARETRRLISTAWAGEALVDQERYERLRDAQPFIFPETITTDRGRNFLSKHFCDACEALGISLITAAPHTPTDKPHVERMFESISSLFLQYTKGYVGRSVEHRGKDATTQSDELLTIAQMQELLEDWIAVGWQNRSHDGLRDPLHPAIQLSPNEMCRAFRHVAPEVHVPMTRDDFIGLLPVVYRQVNRYGVTIDHRIYDSEDLGPIRRRQSPAREKNGGWPIRTDPYNLHVVWLEADGHFIPLRWSNESHTLPMLGDVWRYARHERRSPSVKRVETTREVAEMRQFASKGNPKSIARRNARAAAVAADPMNPTSSTASEPISEVNEPEEIAVSATQDREDDMNDQTPTETSEDVWPNHGGFPLITFEQND